MAYCTVSKQIVSNLPCSGSGRGLEGISQVEKHRASLYLYPALSTAVPKGLSEALYLRRIDNTVAKR